MPELLKNALVLFLLLAVTLLLLQLPGIYYQRQDEQLLQEISTLPYSVKIGSEKMTLEQKLTALISDDTLLTVNEQLFYPDDQFDTIRDNLEKQFASLLPAYWSDQLSSILNPIFPDYMEAAFQMTKTQIFRVVDNKTYSFHLNMLSYNFYMDNCFYDGAILFDAEDYRVFFIALTFIPTSEYEDDFYEYYYDDFYEEFPLEKNKEQLADYYSDLFNTQFQPTCEYTSFDLCLIAFSPYDLSKNLAKGLEDLLTQELKV